MYSSVLASVMFYIFLAVEWTTAAENGYILTEYPEISCKDPSIAISACSNLLDYKIPDPKDNRVPDLSGTLVNSSSLLSPGGEKCVEAGTKYLCQRAYPYSCGDKYAIADVKKLEDTCKQGKKECSGLNNNTRDSLLRCSGLANDPSLKVKILRKLICSDFPVLKNDPYSCKTNYKVSARDEARLKVLGKTIVQIHEILKNASLSDRECEKNVADAMCKAFIPACSIDRTKLVHLLSRQDCHKIVGCVNKTNNANLIDGTHAICFASPDGNTAKKYSLENVYDNKAANHALAFSTILFMATLVAQCFF